MAAPSILYDNIFLLGTPAATDTAAGYSVLNVTDLKDHTFWKAASSGTKYITIDCGSAKSPDCLGLYAHNLDSAQANGSVSVESSADNSNWTPRLSAFTPSAGACVKKFTSVSARYWRVKIVTASVAAQIGVLILGARLDMEQPQEAPVSYLNEGIKGLTEESSAGNFLGAVIENFPINLSANFKILTSAWYNASFLPFWNSHAKRLKPFFYCHDLDNYANDNYFVRCTDESVMNPTRSMAGRIDDFTLSMRGQSNAR
jgi:hypothetical protein